MYQLTREQQAQVAVIRQRFFDHATSTVTDRAAAEAAVAIIVGPVMAGYEIHWCRSPQEVGELRDSLRDSLSNSLRDSLRDSLQNGLQDRLLDGFLDGFLGSLLNSLLNILRDSLQNILRDSLRNILRDSLRDSLRNTLQERLWRSLQSSLQSGFQHHLLDSILDSLLDAPWIAYYSAVAEIGLASYTDNQRTRLGAFEDFGRNAFALWVFPGHVIVLDKPTRVVVTDGKLVDVVWDHGGVK